MMLGALKIIVWKATEHSKFAALQPWFRNKKQPKEKVFGPDIPRTSRGHSCGRPGPKNSGRPSKPWKNKHLGVDIHDPNAWTFMTPGRCKTTSGREFRADVSFPAMVCSAKSIVSHRVGVSCLFPGAQNECLRHPWHANTLTCMTWAMQALSYKQADHHIHVTQTNLLFFCFLFFC